MRYGESRVLKAVVIIVNNNYFIFKIYNKIYNAKLLL